MKIATITGCNRGIGKGILQVLLKEGYFVYGLNKTMTSNRTKNYSQVYCQLDSVDSIASAVEKLPRKIDLLVINAAIRKFSKIEDFSNKDWLDSVSVNLNGAFFSIREILPRIKKAKGDIIVIGSHAEKYAFDQGSAYCSTKLALRGIVDCLIDEVRYNDVRVTYLSIGSVKNRNHHIEESWKLKPKDLGLVIHSIVSLPKKILIPYIDIRPIKPLKDKRPGIEKLQYV